MRPTRRAVLGAPLLLAVPAVAAPVDTYAALLAEEHAAIHLYGVLGPRLPAALQPTARAYYDDHRRHRDLLVELIRRDGGTPPAPLLTYAVPGGSLADPRGVAVLVEDALGVRWHEAVREALPADRARVAGALCDEAAHLATWRYARARSVVEAVSAFPGR